MFFKVVSDKNARSLVFQNLGGFLLIILIVAAVTVSAFSVGTIRSGKYRESLVQNNTIKTVIIDAGHGGFDGGAVVGNVMEKDINIKIANQLIIFLKAAGFNVIATRTDDSSTESDPTATISARKKSDLKNRLEIAKANPEAILVSIHLNKFDSASAKGAQVFYSPKTEGSDKLAEAIKENVISLLQPQNHRAIKSGTKDTYLLYYSPIPAVIAECGFMSNPEELSKLKNEDYQKQMAFAIFCGIVDYYKE